VIDLHDSVLTVLSWLVPIEANRVKTTQIGVRPIWTNPAGSNNSDRLPLAAEASSISGFESESHSNSVMPSTSNAGNEYRKRRDSNDCGIRFGSFPSNMRSRDALSSGRIGTPQTLTIAEGIY
jgi:hypothetical protein